MKIGHKCPLCDWEATDEHQAKHEPGSAHCWHRIKMLSVIPSRKRIMAVAEELVEIERALANAEYAVEAAREQAKERESERNPPDA